jgi:signal transduction histidine kinase
MRKIIDWILEKVFHRSLRLTFKTLDDDKAILERAKTLCEDYATRRQIRISTDGELGTKFRKLFDNSLVAMSFYDKDGYLLDLNERMRQLCGFDAIGEEYFRNTRIFDAPSFKDDLDPSGRSMFHTCQHMYFPELNIDRYLEVRVLPIFDERKQLKYFIVTTRNITGERINNLEQKRKEMELKQVGAIVSNYEKQLQYLLKNSNMYVWSLDFSTRQMAFTRSLSRQDYTESIDEYIESLYEQDREKAINTFKAMRENPQPLNIVNHFQYTPASKEPQWLAITGMPLFDANGQLTGYFGILRHVDDMMTIQEQLRKEQLRAEASGIMKSAFLANMTHEIRTPLNAIVGFSDLLQVVDEPAERQEFIRIIRNNCDMLLRLINDILEASDMGQALAIEPADIDFSQAFDDICQTVAQRVQEPGVEFIKENPYPTLPVHLDKGRIQQVITNFVTNAVKYTHEGHIKVGYRVEEASSKTSLYVYCEDTGAGIPKNKQTSVFERFVKLNDTVQGTGLGLSICKSIIERCGGEIGVTSEGEGHGSTFWFRLPLAPSNMN